MENHDAEEQVHRRNPYTGEEEEYTWHGKESQYDDEGNPIEEDENGLGELKDSSSTETLEERSLREAQEEEDDESAANLKRKQKAYEERLAREKERRNRRMEHAKAAERIKAGSLEKEHLPPQSKRLLNWVVDLKKERAAQQLSYLDKGGPLPTDADVETLSNRAKKTKKDQDDIRDEISTQRYLLKQYIVKTPESGNKKRRIKQREGQIQRLQEGLAAKTKQTRDTEEQERKLRAHVDMITGRTSNAGVDRLPIPGEGTQKGKTAKETKGKPLTRGAGQNPAPTHVYKDGKKVPIHEVEAEARKEDVIRFETLRKKSIQKNGKIGKGKLTESEWKEFLDLEQKTNSYRRIEVPNEEGDFTEKAVRKQTKENLEKEYPVDIVPKPEEIEETLKEYGQENPHPGLVGKYRDKTGGTHKDILGWRSTTEFNKEQARRKYGALKSGEWATGFGKPTEKAKYTLGPNQDWVIKSNEWKPLDEQSSNKGQDSFTFKVKHTGKQKEFKNGQFYETGLTVGDTVRDLGLGVHLHGNEKNEFTVTTDEGEHLNPDQIKALQDALHTFHGMDKKDFKSEGTVDFERLHKRVPVGYSKLPKGLSPEEAIQQRNTLYTGHVGSRFGQRNPDTGELEEGERDSLGLRVGKRTFQRHFDESTDAIGWGTSWRPGEKEISGITMEIPRFRQQRDMADAWKRSIDLKESGTPDTVADKPIRDYIHKYYPHADEAETEEHKNRISKEGAALFSALAYGGYYSLKKQAPKRIGNSAWRGFQRIPGVGPKAYDIAENKLSITKERGNLWKDANWAYRRTLTRGVDRAIFRAKHPLTSGTIDPTTGHIIPDPTVPGIMAHNEFKPNLHAIRYRKHINMPPGRRLGRDFERKVYALKGEVQTTQAANLVLREKTQASRLERWLKLQQARTILHDPGRKPSTLGERLKSLHTDIATRLEPKMVDGKKVYPEFELFGKRDNTTIEKEPELRQMLVKQKDQLENLIKTVEKDPAFKRENMESAIKSYVERHPNNVPKYIWRSSLVGGTAVGAAGLGVLAVDRYQTYERNKGNQVNHPVLGILPETISVPKVHIRKTHELTIPNNTFTRALDFQGDKIPIAGRISIVREQKARLHNFTDVSGEKFKKDLPLLGGIGVSAPAPVEGSLKKSLLPPAKSADLGPTKNMYVKGHKVPVDITVGKKERWDNRSHKLGAKYNRYKLTQDEREKLAVTSTDQNLALTPEGERLSNFYYNNKQFQDILSDRNELARLHKKHSGWLAKTDKKELENQMKRGSNQLLEDQQASQRANTRSRREYQRQQKNP